MLRLVSEGRKAAFRVLMLAQRFEANAVGGGYARDQFALRLSFRVPGESLVMLHGEDARRLGPEHANAAPGVAYLSAPGRDLVRLRAPLPRVLRRVLRPHHPRRPTPEQDRGVGGVNLTAIVIIAFLVTLLLARSHRAGPAVVSGIVTVCLLFAAFPSLGPAVTSGTAEFAHQLGAASDRAANTGDAR